MILTEEQYKKISRLSWEIQGKTYEIESLLEELKPSQECYSLPLDDIDRSEVECEQDID